MLRRILKEGFKTQEEQPIHYWKGEKGEILEFRDVKSVTFTKPDKVWVYISGRDYYGPYRPIYKFVTRGAVLCHVNFVENGFELIFEYPVKSVIINTVDNECKVEPI